MSKYKKYSMLMCSVGLTLLLVGVTYSFFNYTRTGNSNNFSVGRINFVSRNEETITLNNLFPIDPTESGIMNDSTKVGTYEIDIVGDTDYADGIEYLVSITDANIYTSSGKTIPISLNITPNGLGNENSNYFTARESKDTTMYKRLGSNNIVGDGMIMVGFIKPNTIAGTSEGVNGSITIKAYLDKNNIAISDTYDGTGSDSNGTTNDWVNGRTVLTTTEWNNLSNTGISFKIKVEANQGIWVLGSLEEIMRRKAVMDNTTSTYVSASTGIDFGAISSDTNGKGVYTRAGTENDPYPIMYYRGDVNDNNVIFNNMCWKAVRTTDTGGVKLLYNGEISGNKIPLELSDYGTEGNPTITNTGNFVFDTTEKSWSATFTSSTSQSFELSFNVTTGDGYDLILSGQASTTGSVSPMVYKGSTFVYSTGYGGGQSRYFVSALNSLTSTDVIRVYGTATGTSDSPSTLNIKLIKSDESQGLGCDNDGLATVISNNNTKTFKFNPEINAPAYVGYMYSGSSYSGQTTGWVSNAKFGTGFTWDGTDYKLVDATVSNPNLTHHYSCNLTDANATCTDLRYVYYINGSNKYYITLQNGKSIEDALAEMYTNTTSSNIKTQIDTWYLTNMTGVTKKLEDTIWCNDRSVGEGNNNGWIANGGSLSTHLIFGAAVRSHAGLTNLADNFVYSPSLECINKNDRFTVNNNKGNMYLTYPVALLTQDEAALAGGKYSSSNVNYYLNGKETWWLLSPLDVKYNNTASIFSIKAEGLIGSDNATYERGIRPSISIKPGQLIVSGTGTVADPYVIE